MATLPQLLIKPIKRTNRNLSFKTRFTAMPSCAYPIAWYRAFPGEHWEIGLKNLIKTVSARAPIMGSFQVKFDYFFIPDRLFINALRTNKVTQNLTDFKYPIFRWSPNITVSSGSTTNNSGKPTDSSLVVNENSLLNFLGYPVGYFNNRVNSPDNPNTSNLNRDHNGLRFLGYLSTIVNYYINPQETLVPYMRAGVVNTISVRALQDYLEVVPQMVEDGDPINLPEYIASTGISVGSDFFDYFTHYSSPCDQMFLTCYRPDYLTNFLSRSRYQKLVETIKISTADGAFTIDQLRLGNRMQKIVERDIISGSRGGEFVRALWGVNTDQNLDIPEYLGSTTTHLTFDDVVATSNSSIGPNQYIGDVGGRGLAWDSGRKHYINTTEYGNILVMCRVIPVPDYFEGIDKFMLKTDFNDEYNPVMARLGFQPIMSSEYYAAPRPFTDNISGNVSYYTDNDRESNDEIASSYQVAWSEYITKLNEIHGDFCRDMRYWTLGRSFLRRTVTGTGYVMNPSAYIYPFDFNYAWTDSADSARNFMIQVAFDTMVKRQIPKQMMPNLG